MDNGLFFAFLRCKLKDGKLGTMVAKSTEPFFPFTTDGDLNLGNEPVKGSAPAPKPNAVDDETWIKATSWANAKGRNTLEEVAEAIARANELDPGCIYSNVSISTFIARLTILSMSSGDVGKSASKWLRQICVPRQQSNFKRQQLFPGIFLLAKTAYREVLTLRRVYRLRFKGRNRSQSLLKLRETFPDLQQLSYDQLRIVCGEGIDKKTCTPLDAVALLYSLATGYHPNTLKQKLRAAGYINSSSIGSKEMANLSADRLIAEIDNGFVRPHAPKADLDLSSTATRILEIKCPYCGQLVQCDQTDGGSCRMCGADFFAYHSKEEAADHLSFGGKMARIPKLFRQNLWIVATESIDGLVKLLNSLPPIKRYPIKERT